MALTYSGHRKGREWGLLVVTAACPLEEGPAVCEASRVSREVLWCQPEVPQLLPRLNLKDIQNQLQCVPWTCGLNAAEGDQVFLGRTELDEFHL